jgi:hypothetical protein
VSVDVHSVLLCATRVCLGKGMSVA